MDDETTNRMDAADVVVIGGGPGGSTTAALLAKRGRRVLLLERARFPRFHIGESLLPSSFPVLRMLGVEEELDRFFYRKYGARFLDDDRGADFSDEAAQAQYLFSGAFPPSTAYAWEVSRDAFDDVLLRNAVRLGVELREGWSVEEAIVEGGGVAGVVARAPDGSMHRIASRVVVDATGRDGLFTRGRARERGHQRIAQLDKTAIFTHVEGGHRNEGIDVGQIEIIILAGRNPDGSTPGWAWFIPFKDGRSSVGFVLSSDVVRARIADAREVIGARDPTPREYEESNGSRDARLEAMFAKEVERSPWMKKLIGDAPRVGPVRAAADYSFRVARIAGDGWLAVGDAAGFLDPLFSTGAHLAMGGGVRAAEAIDAALAADPTGPIREARFARYVTAIRAATDLFLGAVQSFYRGELRALLFAKKQRSTLRKTITSMLAGDVFHDGPTPALWVSYFRERFPAA
jgi:flavin-dependent dehydrogenase